MQKQTGRSMVEMLSVVAIIAILTILGFWGLRYAMTKRMANVIVNDAYLVFMDKDSENTPVNVEYTNVTMATESGKTFAYRNDLRGALYVKVSDVDMMTCKRILEMSKNAFNVYTTEDTPFTTCENINEMVLDLDNAGAPVECLSIGDCGEEEYCSKKGQCETCPEGMEINAGWNGCACIGNFTYCTDGEEHWCCANDGELICGEHLGENQCVASDGQCEWTFDAVSSETMCYTDCHYVVQTVDATAQMTTDCSYTIGEISETTTYTFPNGETQELATSTLTEDTGCSSGYYCLLNWTQPSWNITDSYPTAAADRTGKIYGRCEKVNEHFAMPIISGDTAGTPVVKQVGCKDGEYCLLNWTQPSWKITDSYPTAAAAATGDLYGRCEKVNEHFAMPLFKDDTSTASGQVKKPCPAGQYCYLNWKSATSCTAAAANASGVIYGSCAQMDETGVCPYEG